MSSEIRIYLDNSNQYYSPGETINGRVECNFVEEKKIRAIFVKFKGMCSTSWTETETYYDDFFKEDRSREVPYSGEEVYFNQELNISGTDRSNFTLPPGNHVFPFLYKLPQEIPTSFEDEDGWASVRYTIKAKIDRPWKFNIESIAVFNVMSPLDLNSIPRIREPVQRSVDKTLCSCWCSNNDTLTFTFSLPTVGYIPGQDVKVGAYVENLTNVSVEGVKFKITKLIEYITTSPTRSERSRVEIVADTYSGAIGAHGEKSWTATLPLPVSKSFPNMDHCSLIYISYRLKGVVQIPSPHRNLSTYVPLMIGHIPLTGESLNVNLGPPPENERTPYIGATAPPLDNTSNNAFRNRNNHGTTYTEPPTSPSGEPAPPSYDDVIKSKCN